MPGRQDKTEDRKTSSLLFTEVEAAAAHKGTLPLKTEAAGMGQRSL